MHSTAAGLIHACTRCFAGNGSMEDTDDTQYEEEVIAGVAFAPLVQPSSEGGAEEAAPIPTLSPFRARNASMRKRLCVWGQQC